LFEEADAALERAFTLNPRAGLLPAVLGTLRLEEGRPAEALEAFRKEEIEALRLAGEAMARHALGQPAASDETMKALIERCSGNGALQIAEAFAFRGEVDRAFEWLERAYEQRDSGLPQMQSWPLLRNLRGDRRWRPFLEKMGLVGSGVARSARDGAGRSR
jgi:tetratricopeptide (TPR) repeat protein